MDWMIYPFGKSSSDLFGTTVVGQTAFNFQINCNFHQVLYLEKDTLESDTVFDQH